MQERAAGAGARLTLSEDPSGARAQVATLERWTGPTGGFRAIAVAPFDAGAVAPVVARAVAKGVKVGAVAVPVPPAPALMAWAAPAPETPVTAQGPSCARGRRTARS